ncbi:hypothetical protein ACFY2M_42815 [Streptomyces sp. NPDC001276]|uniref:hypothetical protein n=1 Tax=Streptomyces sp. NPDC001276 TaxID=3364555 RepID=UPI003691AFD6
MSVEASGKARLRAALGRREVLGRPVADHRADPRDDVTTALIDALDDIRPAGHRHLRGDGPARRTDPGRSGGGHPEAAR